MSSNSNRNFENAPKLHVLISTGLGIGKLPSKYGPGTIGGFVGLLLWIGLSYMLSPFELALATAGLIISSLFIGVWTDNVMEQYLGPDEDVK